MSIGTFGKVVFEVSANKIRTFDEFQKSGSANWETHDVAKGKPQSEFKGPGLEQITFKMLFSADLGLDPLKEIQILTDMRDVGTPGYLMIGGKPVGKYRWIVKTVSESWKTIDSAGNLTKAAVDVTLEEYAAASSTAAKAKTTPKTTSTTKAAAARLAGSLEDI